MSDIPGFAQSMIATNGTRLSVHQAGQGAPLTCCTAIRRIT
ncbi:hypothetical protein QTA57_03995 [Fontisubflavum oceani]|nr:hypothetical protein [Fontisubflavum oceani]WJY22317.1 hypothetical protein QTA57_03995 [Fontisubflavum oceani]